MPGLSPVHRRLLRRLVDRDWHSWEELAAVAGNRYGARLHELRELGYCFVSRPRRNGRGKEYRRASRPLRPRERKVRLLLPLADVHALLEGQLTDECLDTARQALTVYMSRLPPQD